MIAEGDFLVYFDFPRREIENRYTAGMGNFHGDNEQEEYLLKFKRGYFSEWREADQWKMKLIPRVDVMVASSKESNPAMVQERLFVKQFLKPRRNRSVWFPISHRKYGAANG